MANMSLNELKNGTSKVASASVSNANLLLLDDRVHENPDRKMESGQVIGAIGVDVS